jgi:hypothetical protein
MFFDRPRRLEAVISPLDHAAVTSPPLLGAQLDAIPAYVRPTVKSAEPP